jgi:hypothetical protein
MKMLFRLLLLMGLGVIAVGLDVTLWNALRNGHPYIPPRSRAS